MVNILILGGSGILSLDVLKECLKKEYRVTCITRGTRDHRFPEGVNIVHGNVHNLKEVLDKLDQNYDAVLDFLSFEVSDLKYKLDCLASRCKQYFFVSSSVAYSFQDEIITENTKLGNEYWDYGSNKVKCEEYLRRNYKKYGISYTIIRPYITYGKTRIPFGIIPVSGEYWTLANRINKGKPILMWDGGIARCTLTNTEDFAKGYVGLINKPKAYNEAFHITSDEVLTWAEVLSCLGNELHKNPIVYSKSTDEIINILPEYSGILLGDKARDRVFDNSKIKEAIPEFNSFKPFSKGIAETLRNYQNNPIERTMNYEWDGRIDWAISKLVKESGDTLDMSMLKFIPAEGHYHILEHFSYIRGRYPEIGRVCNLLLKIVHFPKKVLHYGVKKIKQYYFKKTHVAESHMDILRKNLHSLGSGCMIGNVDFGKDMKFILIGHNVHIEDGVKFINYRPSAEHFDELLGQGKRKMLRDLGPIIIEDNVFIAANSVILPGVTIGKNSFIRECSVVNGSIPENAVVEGSPAKVVGNINDWYADLILENERFPWYGKSMSHEEIIQEREEYFFER